MKKHKEDSRETLDLNMILNIEENKFHFKEYIGKQNIPPKL